MGKRSNFARLTQDRYQTPLKAVMPLITHLAGIKAFAEPCCGQGHLVEHLELHRRICVYAADLDDGRDALHLCKQDLDGAQAIITNPPWSRELLHALIDRFMRLTQTWLLLDSDWANTKQARPFLAHCSHIQAIGRVKWIPGSPNTGKDNCAWYRFHRDHLLGPHFFPIPGDPT